MKVSLTFSKAGILLGAIFTHFGLSHGACISDRMPNLDIERKSLFDKLHSQGLLEWESVATNDTDTVRKCGAKTTDS